ncbi:MAG TPA: amino acid ABC transporter substrate-binding protein [Puia sp.]
MKTNLRYFLFGVFLWVQALSGQAQTDSAGRKQDTVNRLLPGATGLTPGDSITRHQVAVFVPLYLDSAFDASNNYRYDKNFPKFINPGLEFYEGVQLALDSLEKEDAALDVQIYDTRSSTQSMAQIIQDPAFQHTELIIGHVVPGELQQLASAAAHLNIPFINVNFPNDGGITNNPDFVILNSTLRTHCEGIYKFMQRNYGTRPILLFRKKGGQEDHLQQYFTEIGKSTASVPLKIKYITLDDNFTAASLVPYLDSNTTTICVAGSLDDLFARNLCQALASLNKTYASSIVGMPTWDNIDFSGSLYAGEEIIYSTPFYINPNDKLVAEIQQYFKTKFYSRPSDMVFRGYETTYRFAKLLLHYGKGLSGSIGEKKYKVFNDFDIQPVLNKQTLTLDYLENKKLYFVKKVEGNITAVY